MLAATIVSLLVLAILNLAILPTFNVFNFSGARAGTNNCLLDNQNRRGSPLLVSLETCLLQLNVSRRVALMTQPPKVMIFCVASRRALFWVLFSIPFTLPHLRILLGGITLISTSTLTIRSSMWFLIHHVPGILKQPSVRSKLASWRCTLGYLVTD